MTTSNTKAALQQELTAKMQEIAELRERYVKGELTPEEIGSLDNKAEEAEAIKAQIENFPSIPTLDERLGNVKSFLRKPSSPAPPSRGATTTGSGETPQSPANRGGYEPSANFLPNGGFGIHVKSLGDALVEELDREARAGAGFRPGKKNSLGFTFKGFDRLFGYSVHRDGDENPHGSPYKATLDGSAATLTGYQRPSGIVMVEQQRLTVADLLGQGTTTSPTVRYVREDAYTNAATTVAMAGQKPEASWDLSEIDAPVRKIAVTAKVADEMFADFDQLRSYVDNRLRFMVLQTEEAQLLNGDGNSPNLEGILQTDNVQTETGASAADNIEAVHRGLTKVRSVGFFEPDGIVIHPTDYQYMRLSRDNNEQYYGGGPFTGAYGNSGFQASPGLWGMRTVITTAISAGTVLVGAFQLGAMIFRRNGVMVESTNSNESDFEYNLVTIRAEERLALAVMRPKAFCAVTLNAWS